MGTMRGRRAAVAALVVLLAVGASALLRPPAGADTFPPPVSNVSAIPTAGTAPLKVTFDGSWSTDPNGPITHWNLDFGDGTADKSGSGAPPSPTATHTYTDAGIFTATLTVTAHGENGTGTITIMVDAPRPTPPVARLGIAMRGTDALKVDFDGSATSVANGRSNSPSCSM